MNNNKCPELLDITIGEMQRGLSSSLSWLDTAFGRAERLVKLDVRGRRIYLPCIHTQGNMYQELIPNQNLGNFCFFWIDDPQELSLEPGVSVGIETSFSIIFWLDFRKIFDDLTRSKEIIKRQILDALNGGFLIRSGKISMVRIYELAENIYRGFSLDEIENQFLMHPFGGFRFEGKLCVDASCQP